MKNNVLIGITSSLFTFFLLSADGPLWCRLLPWLWLGPFFWVNFGRYVVEDLREALADSWEN